MNTFRIAAIALSLIAATCQTATAQTLTKPVKIGVLSDMSSLYSAIGGKGSVIAAKMAADDFGGKVLGVPIEILAGDHQNKVDIASTLARRWVDQDGVKAFADVATSSTALGFAKTA